MGKDKSIKDSAFIISRSDSVLVTGANGFIGAKSSTNTPRIWF